MSRIDKKKRVIEATFNPKVEAFIIYIISISKNSDVHAFSRAIIVFLKAIKALTSVLFKNADFLNIFFKNLAAKLLKYPEINDHIINLIKSQLPLYGPIYALNL